MAILMPDLTVDVYNADYRAVPDSVAGGGR